MQPSVPRIAVIGAGNIARSVYFPLLSAMQAKGELRLDALLTAHPEAARPVADQWGFRNCPLNMDGLLALEPDCALVLTPKQVRETVLRPLFEAGVHVYCEKPLAMSLRACERIADAWAVSTSVAAIGFNRRFAPALCGALEAFGGARPALIVANKSKPGLDYRATLENAIHMIDFLRFAGGPVERVEAQGRWTADPWHETLCTAQLSFAGGGVGMLCASREAGAWLERVEMFGPDAGGTFTTACAEMPDSLSVRRADGTRDSLCFTADQMGFEASIRYFLQCVREGVQPHNNPIDALESHRLLHRILHAAGLPDLEAEDGAS